MMSEWVHNFLGEELDEFVGELIREQKKEKLSSGVNECNNE